MAKEQKRRMVFQETYKKGTPWPHGKEALIKAINQSQTVIEVQRTGQTNDGTEYVDIRIDKIDAKAIFGEKKKKSVLDQGLPNRFR